MKSKEEMNNVYFEGRELIHAGWAGGDIPEKNIYKHFYVDKKDSPADDVNHYAVWWDLTDFFEAEEKQVFDWPEPQVYYPISDDSADSVIEYFSKFTPLNKELEIQGKKMTIVNRPVRFAENMGGQVIYWAVIVSEDDKAYQAYWNILNLEEPFKIEMTVDNNKHCKHCLQNWTLTERRQDTNL